MTLHYVNLESLKTLDGGRVSEAFDQAVRRAVADCDDRPAEKKPRVVMLQATLVPIVDEGGMLDGVNCDFQVRDKLPTRKSKVYNFGLKQDGKLFFSDEDPTNHRQLTFGDVDQETGELEQKFPDGAEEAEKTPADDDGQ